MKLFTVRLPIALALVILCCGTLAVAADNTIPVDSDGLPMWVEKEWNDFPVRLVLADREALDALLRRVPIRSFHREQIRIEFSAPEQGQVVFQPRVTEGEFAALEAAGYGPERLRDLDREGREEAERTWRRMAEQNKLYEKTTYPLTYYPTNDLIGTMLQAMQSDYPDFAQYFTWGQSVDGRTLHGVIISDNVGTEEPEAEVRLSSSMHGNEVVGMVMLINFAYYLLENYGQPGMDDVTNLVDNYEVHLIPLYNPDGNALAQRNNSNGVDLNRNFPEPDGNHPSQEIETLQFMSHASHNHFVHSMNAHGGALVMNYPWDYTFDLTPDDAAIQLLALEYSTYNLPMYNGGNYPQGIVRGAIWYVTHGCLQDWSYDQTDCIDITAELSYVKWPAAGQLAGFWDDNRESLMHYVKAARYGINGVVTAADTGLPLEATVTVTGIDKPVHTDPACGDYYKLLHTGTFDLTFEANGYIPQTITGVTTTWGTPTVLDVVMQPGGTVITYPIDEDFETGLGVFSGDWLVTDTVGYNSTRSLTDSEGTYPDNATLVTATSAINLSEISDPLVSFRARWIVEPEWDAVFFEISTDGGAGWTPLATAFTVPASGQGAQQPAGAPCFAGAETAWHLNTVDLAAYVGESDVRFRFRLASDASSHYDGFYVDDFTVQVIGQVSDIDEIPESSVAAVSAYPNPFNPETTVVFNNPRDGHVDLAIFDLQGHRIRTLLSANLPAGRGSEPWDGLTDAGRPAGSGIYVARLAAGEATASIKLTLVQ